MLSPNLESTPCSISLTLNWEGSREDWFRSRKVYIREMEADVRATLGKISKRLSRATLTLPRDTKGLKYAQCYSAMMSHSAWV